MNRNVKSFKGTCSVIFITLVILTGCQPKEQYDLQLEGFHYQDNSPVRISINDGTITKIEKIKNLPEEEKGLILAPGLIDNQVNGYKGYSFVDAGRELTAEGIQAITEGLWEAGTTTYFPTLSTNDNQVYLKNLTLLNRAKEASETRGSIAGIHMEGPYISPENGYRGAHPLIYVRKPDWDEFMELYEASNRNILQITLAPEIEGAMDFITKCKEAGIKVGLGHHNGSPEQINEAVERGAIISTHLGNAIANYIHRWNNPLWPQLANDDLYLSMICDGFHLTPEQIKVYFKAKGPDKIVMTSDMSSLGGLEPGFYLNAIGDTLELRDEGVVLYPKNKSLSGAASPLSKMIPHVMNVTGCDLATAIQMASTNPARLYELTDRGELKPGMRADIIQFTLDDSFLNIKKTVVAGDIVYQKN